MKKFTALFLVFSILTFSIPLTAKERKGADLIVQRTDGTQVRGELIAVKENSLLLMERDSGADVSISIRDIAVIKIAKKSKALVGAGLGFLIGGFTGAIIGTALSDAEQKGSIFSDPIWFLHTPEFNARLYGILVGVLGAIIGGTIGAGAGKDETIRLAGKLDSEIRGIQEILRKKARVKNHQ